VKSHIASYSRAGFLVPMSANRNAHPRLRRQSSGIGRGPIWRGGPFTACTLTI
jgi:hypothetical protein